MSALGADARRLIALSKRLLERDDLDAILDELLEASRTVTGARYAALGVLDADGTGLARFLTSGVDAGTARRIGHPPRGLGVLGEVIREPAVLRLDDVAAHPRAHGFPPGHPPMRTFLGVPLLIRGEAFGNLYVSEKARGEPFSQADADQLEALAGCAAIAIEHARRFDALDARRAELEQSVAGLRATNEISRALGGETEIAAVLELLAARARGLVAARAVVILLVEGELLRVAEVAGEDAAIVGRTYTRAGTLADAVLRTGQPQHLDAERRAGRGQGLDSLGIDAACGLFVPLIVRGRRLGVLAALDRRGTPDDFTAADEELLRAFAVTAAAAVMTAQTVGADRLRDRELAAERERRRWARELHDDTLQGLAAVRMALASARGAPEDDLRAALDRASRALQGEVDRLRAIIHDVRPSSLDDLGLLAAVEALVARHAENGGPALSLDADLDFEAGRVPTRLDAEIETGLYRVAQEALTNALKHAGARRIGIALAEIGDEVGVRVRDDGAGFVPGSPTEGVGLVGIRERVELMGGRLRLTSAPGAGTTLEVRVPARHRPARTAA